MNFNSFFLVVLISVNSFSKGSTSADLKANSKNIVVEKKLNEFGMTWIGSEVWKLNKESVSQNTKSIVLSMLGNRIEITKVTAISPAQFHHRCENEINLAKMVSQSQVTPYSGEIAGKSTCVTFSSPPPVDRFLTESDKNSRIVETFNGETARSGATQCESEAVFAVMNRFYFDARTSTLFKIKMYKNKNNQPMKDVFKHLKSDLDNLLTRNK